jgi:hypothetical protein
MNGGSQDAELTATRVNNDWTVEPGSWYTINEWGLLIAMISRIRMASPHHEGTPASTGTSAEGAAKEIAKETPKSSEPSRVDQAQPADPTPTSDNDWFLLSALECEPKNPRDLLALGKVLGQSVNR